jgi:hypothetical protein
LVLAVLISFVVVAHNGSCVDPDGRCTAGGISKTSSLNTDKGLGVDPNG